MKGWILYESGSAAYNIGYIRLYQEEGVKRDMDITLLFLEQMEYGTNEDGLYVRYEGEEIPLPDFVINRTIRPLLSAHLEAMGVPVFNSSLVSRICNDKALTYEVLAAKGIPVVPSRFVPREQVEQVLAECTYPVIMKSVNGHGGKEVYFFRECPDKIPDCFQKNDTVLQPFIPTKGKDIRVYVLGKEIIVAMLRTAKEGFRSNFSLGGTAEVYSLNPQEKKQVDEITKLFSFGLVGIDFLVQEDGSLLFNELEDVVGSRMLYEYTDISVVALYLDYINNQLKRRKQTDEIRH